MLTHSHERSSCPHLQIWQSRLDCFSMFAMMKRSYIALLQWWFIVMFCKEVHYRKAHGNLYFHYVKLCYYCITIKLNIITSLFLKDWKRGLRIFYIWVGAGLKGANRISCARFYTRCFDIVLTWQSLRDNLIAFGTMSCSYYAVCFCIANRYYFF